jgi:D-hexose-6-phosphate mutarotase
MWYQHFKKKKISKNLVTKKDGTCCEISDLESKQKQNIMNQAFHTYFHAILI